MAETEAILSDALAHHQTGRHDAAEALYRQALEIDPDEPTALYLSGLLAFETGRAEEAAERLRRVAALRPDHVQAQLTLAQVLHWRGDLAEAEQVYGAAVGLAPQNLDARLGLIETLRDQGRSKEALAACEAALALDAGSAKAHALRAGLLAQVGHADEAVDAYHQALALEPDAAPVRTGLALALLAAQRPGEALEAAQIALTQDMSSADGWFVLAEALSALGQTEEAIAAFTQTLLLDPRRAGAHLDLGGLYAGLERGEPAIAHLRAAIEIDPSLKEAHASLGSVYLLTGQDQLAEASCRAALALDPAMQGPHQNLASLMARRGDDAAARAHRDAAYRGRSLQIEEAAAPRRRVLILSTAESGNTPSKHLWPKDRNTRLTWVIEYADEGQAARLPPYDVVFNAIGDPDLAGPAVAPVARFLASCAKPVLNPPDQIARTARQLTPTLLAGIPGLTVAPTVRATGADLDALGLSDRLAEWGLAWPVLARPIGSHGGKGVVLAHGGADLAEFRKQDSLYLTQFRDFRSADGWWRKYRVIFVDRQPYPYHAALSERWLVHYESAGMEADSARLAEELRFLENPEAALGAGTMAAIAEVGRRLDLDYGGVDFTLLPTGDVLVFEANATMLAHPESGDGPLAHKNPYVRRILDAFEAMVESRL